MGSITAGIMAVVLSAPFGLRPPENVASGMSITEEEIRETSAKHYSELIRRACANGWTFSRREAVAGFNRHFQELRLVLIDRGTTIMPLAYTPELEITETVFGSVERSSNPERWGCFRGRWLKQRPGRPLVPSEVKSTAR